MDTMQTLFDAVICLNCGHEMDADVGIGRCSACGGAWVEARYDIPSLYPDWPDHVAHRPHNMWRYRELLPFPDDFAFVTMGEGWTPLTRASGLEQIWTGRGSGQIWIKDERQQPTGSLKDRQAALTVSTLKAQGIDEMAIASTGNAAAAYAAFCARAGIKLWIFLPSSVPAEKMRELALYGAEVIKVSASYDRAKAVATEFAERRGIYKDQGAKAVPGKESMKTIALEIAEQLGWSAPDWYIQAVSGGIGPLGVLKGFTELYEAGIVDRIPKLGVVQAEGCAPMVRSWEQGLEKSVSVEPETLVTVLATGQPGYAYEILKDAIDTHGGAMVSVSDGEAFRAMRRVARTEGMSMEPAAGVSFAGLDKLLETAIQPDERVVINCSGHTFSAEKHILEDRYALHVRMDDLPAVNQPSEGLDIALEQIDEQVTSVVVIDDNPSDSRLIRRLLKLHKQYRVFEAHSAEEGLELVRQRQPDLVILDLMMPDMNGFSILDEIKADGRTDDIPVIIISAKTLTSKDRDYLRRYTDSVWRKGDFSVRELADHVAEVLGDPLETIPSEKTDHPKVTQDWRVKAFGTSGRPRILVVDDYVSDARLMHRLFDIDQRFEVVEAYSALEAMEVIERTPPDLIILDLMLPDTSGEKLLETLRKREETRDKPVIVVSAKDINPSLRAYLTSHTDSVWSKAEMDRSSLLDHVEAILSE
jgi:threonine synthase